MRSILLDTGPLVALLTSREQHHKWADSQWQQLKGPILTCEAVLAEACFLMERTSRGGQDVLQTVKEGAVQIGFQLETELEPVLDLMHRYANVPMSLADACLVRMAEQHPGSRVFTLDSDFRIYRKNRRQTIPVIMPDTSG